MSELPKLGRPRQAKHPKSAVERMREYRKRLKEAKISKELNTNKKMSSCQGSIEDEESIPPPEYEQIGRDAEVEEEDDDEDENDVEEFWIRTDENGQSKKTETVPQQQKTDAAIPSQLSTTTSAGGNNGTEWASDKNKPLPMEDDDEEISYDEADENFEDEIDDNEASRKSVQTTSAQTNDQLNIKETLETVSAIPVTVRTTAIQSKNSPSSLVVVTLVNENGNLSLPLTSTPTAAEVTKTSTELPSPPLPPTEVPRSGTPSGRGNREFLALQKSFTESKVLSEFVNEKERSRKSRKLPLKSEDSNTGEESEKFRICRARSKSCTRTANRPGNLLNLSAPLRWPSDDKLNTKRENMRSQNTEFVQKQMNFLSRVNHEQTGDEPITDASDEEHSLNESNKTTGSLETKVDCWQPPPKRGADSFCWKCRKCGDLIACSKCPRSFHAKCSRVGSVSVASVWTCPECIALENCINGSKKSKKENLPIDMLNQLLLFALKRMKEVKGHERLLNVPDRNEFPDFDLYVVNPVTLNTIQEKIEKKVFRCTEEFILETRWIQHNVSIAYAAYTNKDLMIAKTLLKVCRQEAAEIETCPECYLNANTRKDWFLEVCLKPHILLWAKLKGFPYWPAKGMGVGPNSLLNVRFFGAHDRAFVPIKDCYLYSAVDPNPFVKGKRSTRSGIAECIKEIDVHIQKIKATVGAFNFAPPRTNYDPNNEMKQLEEMMPGVTEYVKRQQLLQKPSLTLKIIKTADNNLSIIRKTDSGTDSDHSMQGPDKNIKNSNEDKKSIEMPTTQPKPSTSTSKVNTIKPSSSTYEVIAKPMSKDDTNSSKISSMILKRKAENVCTSPSIKKSRSSEEDSPKEQILSNAPVESSSSSTTVKEVKVFGSGSKQEVKVDEPKESIENFPAKKMRLSSESLSSSSKQKLNDTEVEKKEDNKLQEKMQQKQPEPSKPQQPQKKEAPAPSKTESPSKAMSALVQNRQGVTIRKIGKSPSGITTYFATDDRNSKNVPEDKGPPPPKKITVLQQIPVVTASSSSLKTGIASYFATEEQNSKNVQEDKGPPPQQKISPPQLKPLVMSTYSSKLVSSSPRASRTSVPSIGPASRKAHNKSLERLVPPKGLIPFEDIKLETSEEEDLNVEKQKESAQSRVSSSNSKSTSPTLTISSSPTQTVAETTQKSIVDPLSLPINPNLVKAEVISEDDSSINSLLASETLTTEVTVVVNQQTVEEDSRLVGETMIKRIVVRSLESLTKQPSEMQPSPLSQSSSSNPTTTPTTSSNSTITAAPVQTKKPTARARKSFPNKGPNLTTAMLPPEVRRSLTKNSMVYIPVDSQKNAVPIKPLTAVSKTYSHPIVKIKGSTAVSAANTVQANNLNSINTACSPGINLPTSIAIPLPAPPPSSQTIQMPTTVSATSVSTANLTITTTATSSVITSSMAYRQNYCSTADTVTPMQSSQAQSVPTTPADSECNNKNMREAEGHILSGIVTPNLAAAITDTIVCGPPRLTRKPNGALRSNGNYGFNSDAGPVCRTLVESAHKITDFFISVMQDTVNDMSNADVLPAKIVELQMELETKTAEYEKQLYELKQNTDTMLCEMKKSMEAERTRIIAETRKQCEIERIHAIEQTKKKQWCANCGREASSYCCWNTAYCDNNCQGIDWTRHKPNCCQVNPHLNPELQGPGVLYSGQNMFSIGSTVTTPSIQTISCTTTPGFMPIQPLHIYRSNQPTPPPTSSLSSSPAQISSATTIAKKLGNSPPGASYPNASASIDMAYKSKEVLKLPPSTYLRAIPPSIRLNTPQVHRFNIPLPLNTAATTGGPPYTLVNREGNWQLLGTHQTPNSVASSSTFQHQPTRLVSTVTANLTPDSRSVNSATLRQNQI